MGSLSIRPAAPHDHDAVVAVADAWWGRPVADALPRLFLQHFHNTSLIAHDSAGLGGFLIAFFSPARTGEAYIHFAAVRPDLRRAGVGRGLYETFFDLARAHGQTSVVAITPSLNTGSMRFHRTLGFDVLGPLDDYNRQGDAQFVFRRGLEFRVG